MRRAALDYESREPDTLGWGTGMLLGPYGLGIAAASKEHREKQRAAFNRQMHLQCSSQPLPPELRVQPPVE